MRVEHRSSSLRKLGAYGLPSPALAGQTGAVLSAAIAGQFPDQFPVTTDSSDTAMAPDQGVNPIVLVGLGLVSSTMLTLVRRPSEARVRNS